MVFEELEKNNIEIPFEYNPNDKIYVLKNKDVIVGYGTILMNNDNKDILYFMIKEKYQSNGYGSMLYKKLLKELDKMNYKSIIIHIPNKNIKAINIINKYENRHLTTVQGISEYLIPIK